MLLYTRHVHPYTHVLIAHVHRGIWSFLTAPMPNEEAVAAPSFYHHWAEFEKTQVTTGLSLMEEAESNWAVLEAPVCSCGQELQPICKDNLQGSQCVLSLWKAGVVGPSKQPILTAVNKSSPSIQKTAILMQAITELITKILICSLK